MAGEYGWRSPYLFNEGDPLTLEAFRSVIADLEDKFNGKISSADLSTTDGKFELNADLDLLGHNLLNAANVATGIANIKAYGVIGDGREEAIHIQSALDQIANDGYRLAYFPGGTYRSDGYIKVPMWLGLMGAGANSVLEIWSGEDHRSGYWFSGSHVSMQGFTVVSGDPDSFYDTYGVIVDSSGSSAGVWLANLLFSELTHGLRVHSSSAVTLMGVHSYSCDQGLRFYDCKGVGVVGSLVMGNGTEGGCGCDVSDCSDVYLVGSVRSSGGHGVKVSGCRAASIMGSAINCNGSGVVVERSRDVTVVGFSSVDGGWAGTIKAPGIMLMNSDNCVISGCQSYSTLDVSTQTYGLEVIGGSNHVISGNVLYPNKGATGDDTGLDTYDSANCMKIGSTNTIEYGNFEVRI